MSRPREERTSLFPALLKYWRGRRGLSQLDFALAADSSARHISFLETGRTQPSEEMVLRLAATLQVPLREQNMMLRAAGFAARFAEPSAIDSLGTEAGRVLELMLARQEPYPMMVMDRLYNILRANHAGQSLFLSMLADPAALAQPLNAVQLLFDPRGARPYIADWPSLAHGLVARLHREALAKPHDDDLAQLVTSLFTYPDVPEEWRQPDFSVEAAPFFTLALERNGRRLTFVTTMTVFSAPQNVTLEELRIESYFPADDETAAVCHNLST